MKSVPPLVLGLEITYDRERMSVKLLFIGLTLLLVPGCRCGREARTAPPDGAGGDANAGSAADASPAGADGGSVDPPRAELAPTRAMARERGFETSLEYFRDLAGRYPRSALVQLRAAEAAQYAPEPDPAEAERRYRRGLELHEGGSRLSESDQWQASEGLGLVLLAQGKNQGAREQYQRVTSRWPGIPQSQYNLACAHCLVGDLEGCAEAFARALEAAEAGRAPDFVLRAGTVDYFIRTSRRDPDLARLRSDPRYESIIERFQSEPSGDAGPGAR